MPTKMLPHTKPSLWACMQATKKGLITPLKAILQMEMLGHDFFVFLDMDTDDVSVVYKRKGNAYGLIETKR